MDPSVIYYKAMKNTTLCYIEKDGQYLMLHRVKKENDLNHDKWIGVGGRFEKDESPEECLLREVWEETGLTLDRWCFHGVVTFISDQWETEYMYLFTADRYHGDMIDCDEGDLEWVDKEKVPLLPLWEGDKLFFRLLAQGTPPFLMTLRYAGDKLVFASLNGEQIVPSGKEDKR